MRAKSMAESDSKDSYEASDRVQSTARIRWRLGLLAATVFSILSIYPQVHLWVTHSDSWQHAVAYNQGLGDEVAYAAYVNALIEGKPRRNDPYTGRGDSSDARLPESLFSIQFVPAYAIALPARALGLSATTAFILITPVVAFSSSLLVFWLLTVVTGDSRLSACGILAVLCLGTFVSGEGTVSSFIGSERHFDFFPFLRRYEPSVCFPIFLLFLILVCKFFAKLERPILLGILSGASFAILIYSYFYLWTAAAAWFAIIALITLLAQRAGRRQSIIFISVVTAISVCAFIPYFVLIWSGSESARTVQALVSSRTPDLLSPTVLIGAAFVVLLVYAIRRGNLSYREPAVLAAGSFALLPIVVLNQQILTGHVLQPIHYKGFITSYSVLIASVVTLGLNWRTQTAQASNRWRVSGRVLLWITIAAFDWGLIEAQQAMKRGAEGNNLATEEMPVYVHFSQRERAGFSTRADEVLLFDDLRMADAAPAVSSLPVLWAPHMIVYPGVNAAESKERLFKHLYYTGVGVQELDNYFHGRNVYYGCAVGLFGFDRLIDGLNPNAKPITSEEKKSELDSYRNFIETFDEHKAASPRLSYVIVPTDKSMSMANLDRWYRRDNGQQVGKFTIFRVELRDDHASSAVSIKNETARRVVNGF
jgi:hypothetical protein